MDIERFCLLFPQGHGELEALSMIFRSEEEDEEEIKEFRDMLLQTNMQTHPRGDFLTVVLYVMSIPREKRKVSLLRDTKYWGRV